MTIELTEQDFVILRRSRRLRLHSELQLDESTVLYLDSAYQLHICCQESTQACNILQRKAEVKELVYLITGCEQLNLWLKQERVWAEATCEIASDGLDSIESRANAIEDSGMGTATLEKPTTQTLPTQLLAINENFVPIDQLAEQISSITGQPIAVIIKQILAAKPEMDFDGTTYTVAPNAGDMVIDHWAEQIKMKIRSLPATTAHEQNGSVAEPEPELEEPDTEPNASALKLPSGLDKLVSNRYQPTLVKFLPEDTESRSFYLTQLTSETDAGKSYLNKIAKAIAKKYKNKPDANRAYTGLLNVAKELQSQATAST